MVMMIIEVFCLGVLLGTVPIVAYLFKKKIDESSKKFDKAHSEMKDAAEKLRHLHEDAVTHYSEQAKKIEKLQTEMNIIKTTSMKRQGVV